MSVSIVVQSTTRIRLLHRAYKFTIGFMKEEYPDQSCIGIFSSVMKYFTIFDVWHGARSLWNFAETSNFAETLFPFRNSSCSKNFYILWRVQHSFGWHKASPKHLLSAGAQQTNLNWITNLLFRWSSSVLTSLDPMQRNGFHRWKQYFSIALFSNFAIFVAFYVFAQLHRFSFIALVRSCFHAGLQAIWKTATRRLQTVEERIWIPFSFKFVFNAWLVLRRSFLLCRSKYRASSLGVVFFLLPPLPLRLETSPVSCFILMTRLTVTRPTPITATMSLYVLAACSYNVPIFLRFLGVMSISNGSLLTTVLQLMQQKLRLKYDATAADAVIATANWENLTFH